MTAVGNQSNEGSLRQGTLSDIVNRVNLLWMTRSVSLGKIGMFFQANPVQGFEEFINSPILSKAVGAAEVKTITAINRPEMEMPMPRARRGLGKISAA